ncbi:cellular tumor antigen p53-like isoform X2 [Stegodyphus dumicola]|uniref:cellular tumor antigen p53-like isoform X2 n=1 Tax=Stegodyphus dumicola TaxID=202533 RepID=UPI0015AA1379|nr:cellular tumor antigen p53-like isoform X2 [Stegodyphus dumicola]
MAEEYHQSSDESPPLSQNSFAYLWNEIKQSPVADAVDGNFSDNYANIVMSSEEPSSNPEVVENISSIVEKIGTSCASIQIPQALISPTVPYYTSSSLPATENFPGNYSFSVGFRSQEKNTKGVTWTYSEIKDKLYVSKDTPCPINFSTNTVLHGAFIRAMALFSSPDNANNIVTRCVTHSMEEISKGIFEAEHLVRCESNMALYQVDPAKRHSVTVPFENPPAGQLFSTYIYKFVCFGSCAGGPNRRPLILVFTLEKGNEIIGRRKFDIKICACPARDRRTEENQLMQVQRPLVPAKQDTLDTRSSTSKPKPKKRRSEKEEPYILKEIMMIACIKSINRIDMEQCLSRIS